MKTFFSRLFGADYEEKISSIISRRFRPKIFCLYIQQNATIVLECSTLRCWSVLTYICTIIRWSCHMRCRYPCLVLFCTIDICNRIPIFHLPAYGIFVRRVRFCHASASNQEKIYILSRLDQPCSIDGFVTSYSCLLVKRKDYAS